jgi:hypothetical protein
VNNALLIANTGAIHHPGTGTTGPANNAYFVGNSMDLSGAASFPTNGRNFVSRDNVNLSAGASLIRGPLALNAKDGLVIGNSFDLIGIEQGSGIIQNVAFINNIALSSLTSTRMFFMATADPHPEFTLKNLLLVDENSELRYGIFANIPTTAEGIENVTIDSVGFSDFNFVSGADTARVFQDSIGLHVAHNRGTNLCFFNVQEEANGIAAINTANTWTRGIPPSFVNPEKSRYNSSSGTAWSDLGCGLSKTKPAGVCKMNRTLSWSNLQPECMADFGIGGGGSSPNFAPRAFGNFL